jgi:hypothetical protein
MTNTIQLDANNVGSFLGPIAAKYSYTPSLRKRLDEVFASACRSTNKAFVLNGETVVAAQSTIDDAAQYMTDDTVLVSVELPKPTPEQLSQAEQMWAFKPFRKCFIALKAGEEMQVILKPTAHYAGKLSREGWTVRELHRGR